MSFEDEFDQVTKKPNQNWVEEEEEEEEDY